MCGIFGVVTTPQSGVKSKGDFNSLLEFLFVVSQSRGMESSGVAIQRGSKIDYLKTNVQANDFIKLDEYRDIIESNYHSGEPMIAIGHSRMVTNGVAELHKNNQPVARDGLLVVHNGIITNEGHLTRTNPEFKRTADVDSELIPMLIRSNINVSNNTKAAVRKMYEEIQGATSIALLGASKDTLVLASNTGSLYRLSSNEGVTVFASERIFLSKLKQKFSELINWNDDVVQISDANPVEIDARSNEIFDGELPETNKPLALGDMIIADVTPKELSSHSSLSQTNIPSNSLYEYNIDAIKKLTRCANCILPETFPFITFNKAGICNYCENYKAGTQVDKKQEFSEFLDRNKSDSCVGDSIQALSGGRDSTYALHLLKTEFGMNPVTFTYDWGMVTDIARQNISEITGKLGVENILISADIPTKLNYIRMNVAAWLKKPDLGIIPLFMAGDKFFFKYVNQVKKDTGIMLDIWSPNSYENTDFKTGFCGIPPKFNKEKIDDLGIAAKMKLPAYYLKQYLSNPRLINSSIVDTVGAFWSYYFEPRDHICLTYDYLPWDEDVVEGCLVDEYGWEVSERSGTTWRRGDGTAPFYNYIYYTVAGFSEFDTFRSNQIRDGVISREVALQRVERENQPDPEGLNWYFNRIGLNSSDSIRAINRMPKLYSCE